MSTQSLTTSSVRTHVRRPKVSFSVECKDNEEMTKDNDPLPVVELKPFVQKVWRREKSFAGPGSDRSVSVSERAGPSEPSHTSEGSRIRELDATSEFSVDDGSSSPRTAYSLPVRFGNSKMLSFYVNAFDDFRTQKEHLNSIVGESELKRKQRLHPLVQSKHKKRVEHTVSIIPGFITRDDRVKTTLTEIGESEMKAPVHSYKALTGEEFQRQQMIRVSGEPLYQRKHPPECTPTPVSRSPHSWHSPSVRHGSPASLLYNNTRNVLQARSRRPKTPLYDHIDRSGVLPSLSIHASSLKHRPKRNDDGDSEDYVDYRDVYDPSLKHNVGGIENSFDVLSKYGKPTKLERQLTIELETNLSRLRKSKDYSPFEVNPAEIAKYYPGVSQNFNMTQGELQIQMARRSNASRQTPRKGTTTKLAAKQPKSRQSLSTGSTTSNLVNQFSQLRKSFNEIDHIDTFDSLPQRLRNGHESQSPEDEPSAPCDTPRSRMESRHSNKLGDMQGRIQNEPVKELMKEMVENDQDKVNSASVKDSAKRKCSGAQVNVKEERLITPAIVKSANVSSDKQDKGLITNKQTHDSSSSQNELNTQAFKNNSLPAENGVDAKEDQKRSAKTGVELPPITTSCNDVKQVDVEQANDVNIDASGRTFITTDTIPQLVTADV